MFSRLLIPLDGSRLAENVLPVATWLAERFTPEIVLIHVVEPDAPKEVHGERHLQDAVEADEYLKQVQRQWFPSPNIVSTHVHSDDVAGITEGILMHAAEFDSDLILMCTHGHTGPRQFFFGTVAQKVASKGDVPVFFVRARSDDETRSFSIERILVPLDGDPEHELGMRVAVELAQPLDASLHLLRVVQKLSDVSGGWTQTARLLPSTTAGMLDIVENEARLYLDDLQTRLQANGALVSAEVKRGEPSDAIADAAGEQEIDLIVVGTHGKIGGEGFWLGSITPRICERTQAPILLVPTSLVKKKSRAR